MVAALRPSLPTPSRGHIVLAEDDAALRDLLADALEAHGYHVVALADGGRLLVELAASMKVGGRRVPDLIVSDIRMPVMSGLQMAIAMRELDTDLPLILLTAFPDPQLEQRVKALDAHLLAKPFPLADLLELVERCLPRA